MAKLPAGKARDRAVQTYVSQVSWQSPEYAAPWVSQLADEHQRYSSVMNVARNWMEFDRPAAEKWVAGLDLPEEKKKQLLDLK
jgi:hypothetical protein